MTDKQIEMARHALGLPNKQKLSYRNHFCIGPGGDGYEDWLSMVEEGYAVRKTGPHWGGADMFHLTTKGAREVRKPDERIDPEEAKDMRLRETEEEVRQ